MSSRGPSPKPSAQEIFEGMPGKRGLNPHEPKPAGREPKIPKYLDAKGRKHWRELAPILSSMRVLTEADGQALGLLCQKMADHEDLVENLRKTGWLVKNPSGAVHPNPLAAQTAQTSREILLLLREFGLTPSARTRVHASEQKRADALDLAMFPEPTKEPRFRTQ